jgi:hypothetical protein
VSITGSSRHGEKPPTPRMRCSSSAFSEEAVSPRISPVM